MRADRRFRVVVALIGLVGMSGAASAGCGAGTDPAPGLSQDEVETEAQEALEERVGARPEAMECDSGLGAEVDDATRCVLIAGGERIGLTVTVTGVEGDRFDVEVDDVPLE
ncbi:DUF4333 domain-containing protein [Haloechinothrix sp. LS1_15]|uniref:DUF4333 domain-containing protein n=1 Tax=Haloechinothrix sp. LS1_15 TaxID=2652248 RepID=UPI0029441435|nr:DUF4333 domain-containing protein [Haloechinothrix sp. LS1_15]MDV6014715.1 DUF4333 domain-containing protein [Haloechinothrix sp. LS1_15]